MEIWDNLSCPQQGNYNLIWIAGHIWSEDLVWHCYCDERYWDPAIFAKYIHFFITFSVFGSFCSSHKLSTISMEVAKILSLNRSNFHKRSFVRLFVPHHQHSLNFYFPKFSRREIWRSALSNSGQTTFCSHSETSRPPFEYVILQRKWWVKNRFRLLPQTSKKRCLNNIIYKTISLNNIAQHLKIFDLEQWDCSSIQDFDPPS